MKSSNSYPKRETLEEGVHSLEDFWPLAKTPSYRLFLIVLEIQLSVNSTSVKGIDD